jgi:hypothetical protein
VWKETSEVIRWHAGIGNERARREFDPPPPLHDAQSKTYLDP